MFANDSGRKIPSMRTSPEAFPSSDNTIEQSLLTHTNGMLLLIFAGGFCPEV